MAKTWAPRGECSSETANAGLGTPYTRAIACVGSSSNVVRIPDLESQVERSRASLVELGPRVDGVNQLMGLMQVTLRSCSP